MFSIEEIREILDQYAIGQFKSFWNVKKDDENSFGQAIETTQATLFMKILRRFDDWILQSIVIAHELYEKDFPTYKTYLTKEGKVSLNYKDRNIVLYEYIKNLEWEWKDLSVEEIHDFARVLAKFHKLTKWLEIQSTTAGTYQNIKILIDEIYTKKELFGLEIQNIISYMKTEILWLTCPESEYLTGFYSEYNPGHVMFENNKVKYVIDWDIGKEHAFYDYGSSMMACFSIDGTKFFPEKLKEFVVAYNQERPLADWEKDNLFESFKFGVIKYWAWRLVNLDTKEINPHQLDKLKYLIGLNKKEFNDMINVVGINYKKTRSKSC